MCLLPPGRCHVPLCWSLALHQVLGRKEAWMLLPWAVSWHVQWIEADWFVGFSWRQGVCAWWDRPGSHSPESVVMMYHTVLPWKEWDREKESKPGAELAYFSLQSQGFSTLHHVCCGHWCSTGSLCYEWLFLGRLMSWDCPHWMLFVDQSVPLFSYLPSVWPIIWFLPENIRPFIIFSKLINQMLEFMCHLWALMPSPDSRGALSSLEEWVQADSRQTSSMQLYQDVIILALL